MHVNKTAVNATRRLEPRRGLAARRRSKTAHAQIFDLEVVLDAVLRAFAAEAGLLDAAERRDLFEMRPVLMPTMPYSSASATRQIRPMSWL